MEGLGGYGAKGLGIASVWGAGLDVADRRARGKVTMQADRLGAAPGSSSELWDQAVLAG